MTANAGPTVGRPNGPHPSLRRKTSRGTILADRAATVVLWGTGVFVLAVVTGERSYDPNPPADRVLHAGETLVVSGSVSRLRELRGFEAKAKS